jgi:hypothetical protein
MGNTILTSKQKKIAKLGGDPNKMEKVDFAKLRNKKKKINKKVV